MFQFDRPAALESSHITVRSEPNGVPEPDWRLHAKFVLEGVCRFVAGTAGLGRAPLLPAAKREPQSGSRGRQRGSGRIGNLS